MPSVRCTSEAGPVLLARSRERRFVIQGCPPDSLGLFGVSSQPGMTGGGLTDTV
jgi:hypothetical protein